MKSKKGKPQKRLTAQQFIQRIVIVMQVVRPQSFSKFGGNFF